MTDKPTIPAPRPRRVTAQMVADAAGVSRSAVSRAFTDGAYLDEEKRRLVKEVALRLGYQPNALAAGLKGGPSHLVAIIAGNMQSAYDTEFVSHLVRRLNARGKWPILIDGGDAQAGDAVEKVLSYPLDALILRGGSIAEDVVAQCAKLGIAMITTGRQIDAPHVDTVCCRNADGAEMAVTELLARGRRRFGFIGGPEGFSSSVERRAGVLRGLGAAGLELVGAENGDFTFQGGHRAALALNARHDLDALLCVNDATALGALFALREAGVRVPEAVSIVGFDDIDMASWPGFNLSTLRNPIDETVQKILEQLEKRLADPQKPGETMFVAPQFIARGTH